jgi:hypothetical protein
MCIENNNSETQNNTYIEQDKKSRCV